ncbi:hypothetical protein Vadar_028027 [Vaccinium darrowii]|uniref:Uncharacterized protein n=1 Tax=Vaccinium darrowii TaxID=229202 RepID=A0ACB7XKH5_9ERIC|nr:hypothetical protein Vadar_028027 [Vaccinium darrowii]
MTPKTRREKYSPVTKLGFLTELRDFSDSITMATPPPSSLLRPTKRRRKNQNEHEDEDPKDSSTECSPNGTEKHTKKKISPVVVFAHGAGAPSSSDWMIRSSFSSV